MKLFKKLISAIATAAMTATMLLGSGMTAFADETADASKYTLTITNSKSGHTYKAYQIFSGDYTVDESGKGILSNLEWGSGVNKPENTTPEAWIAENITGKSESEWISNVKGLGTTENGVTLTESGSGENVVYTAALDPGYYIVYDQTETVAQGDAFSAVIVDMVGNKEIEVKAVYPTDTKEVKDESDETQALSDNNMVYGKAADHHIGEKFQFRLTATLPKDTDYSEYEQYMVTFHDKMSDGLTFDSIDSVKVNGTGITMDNTTDYSTTASSTTREWTLGFDLRKALGTSFDSTMENSGATVEVIYTAHLNENAFITTEGHDASSADNQNESWLEYSNNPNGNGTGTTEHHHVYVYTYELNVFKYTGNIDDNPTALSGAEFTLTSNDGVTLQFIQISDGKYKVYDASDNTISADTVVTTLVTPADGHIYIDGLDAGNYTLTETKAPAGYNKLKDPIDVTINAAHTDNDGATVTTSLSYTAKDADNNDVTVNDKKQVNVLNQSGSTLPSTGGMGTTIFYIAGAVLVIAAAVIMISRKRMSASED